MNTIKTLIAASVLSFIMTTVSTANTVNGSVTIFSPKTMTITVKKEESVLERYNKSNTVAIVDKNITTDDSLIDVLDKVDALYIKNGIGGKVMGMMHLLMYLESNNKTIIIDGECASACTMLLYASDNVLYTENARLQFHSSYMMACKNGKPTPIMDNNVNQSMLQVYPTKLKEWIIENKVFEKIEFTEIDNVKLKELVPNMFISSKELYNLTINGVIKHKDSEEKIAQLKNVCK